MPSNNFKKWVQAYDRGQAAKNELEQAQNRYKQSNSVTAKASRKLTNAGYRMARSKYLQDQEAIGGGGVGVGGVDQLGNAMGRQSGAVDFRNNLIVGRLANADYTGTYSNLRNNNTFLTEQAQRIAQQREAGNRGRTAMLKSKVGRFTLGAVEGLGSGLSFGMTDRGGNAIQNWQDQGATNLTDAEALEAQNSGTYKAGRVVGEMSSYLVPYGMTHELAGKVASKLKVDKLMSKAVEKIGGKTLTRMAENELGRNLARTEAKRLAGKVVAGELTEDAAKKSILKGVTKQAGKKTLDATRAEIKQRLSHELARDFVQDVALGNVQDIAMAHNRGEKITPQFLIANNLMNLGIGGLVDVAPALKGLKNIDAERVTGRELGKALKTAEPEKTIHFKTPAQRSAAQSFDDILATHNERAQVTRELARLANSDENAMDEALRLRYLDEVAKGETNPNMALINAERSMIADIEALRKPTTPGAKVETSRPAADTSRTERARTVDTRATQIETLKNKYEAAWLNEDIDEMEKLIDEMDAIGMTMEEKRALNNEVIDRAINNPEYQARTAAEDRRATLAEYGEEMQRESEAGISPEQTTAGDVGKVRNRAGETISKNSARPNDSSPRRVTEDIPRENVDVTPKQQNASQNMRAQGVQKDAIPERPTAEPKPQKTFKKVPHLEGKDKLVKFKVGEKEAQRITQNKVYAKAIDDPKFWTSLERQDVTPEFIQAQAKYQGRPAAAVLTDYAKVYDLNNRKIDTIAERIKTIKDIDAEAKKALTEYASLDIPRSELFGAPADVKIKGQKLEKLPTSQKELEKMQEQIGQTLVDDDYTTPIVSSFKPDGTSTGDRWREYLYGMKKRWFDSGQAFYEFGKKNKDVLLYAYFDNFVNYRGQAESMIGGNGHWSGTLGKEVQDCQSLGQIFDPIYRAKAADEFNEYMFHRHNIQRMEYDKPVFRKNGEWVTAKESEDIVKAFEDSTKNPHAELFKKQADEIYKYERTLTKMEVEAGLLTEGHAEYLWEKYPNYVPTHRDIAKLDGLGASVSNRRVKARRQSKGAIGSDLPLIRLEEQLVSRTNQTCQACALNDLGVRLLANVDDPHMIRSIREINTEDIIKGWEDDFNSLPDLPKDIPLKGISEEDGKYFFDISTQSRAYRIEIDKELYKALEVETKTTPEIKALAKTNKVFKDLVTTYNPFFGLFRNPARDILDSFSFSKYGTRSYVASYKDAIGHMIRRDSTWQMYKSMYGAGESVYDLARGYKKHSWLRRNTLDRIAQVNGAIENMGRFAAYLDTLKHEGDGMDAIVKGLHNAREVTVNFGRSGTVGRVLNKNFVPFFNAGIQDVVRIGRAVKEGRLGTLLVGAAMLGIGPSVINELIYAGDEDYQRLRQSDKDLNFLIKIGDGRFLKIPKGRVGSVIAMPAQRTARLLTGNAKDGDAYKGMGKIAIEQIAPVNPVTNNIFAPLVGAATNRTWYGGEIESSYLQKLPAGERSDENTTPWAKWLGEKLNLSPKKIDYVLNQYSGVLGQAGKSFVPSKRGSNPVLNMAESNFIVDAVTNNELSTKFYAEYNKAEQTKNSSKGTRADKIYYKYLEKIKGTTSPYTVDVKEYLNDTDLNYSEKRGKVRDARRQQNKLYEDALNKKNAMKAAIEKWDGQLKVQDYKTDSAYDNDVYQHALMDVYGADKALEMTDAEKYDKVKAAKWTPQGYMKAKTASGKYSNGMAKSMVAMDNGANTYEKAKLIDSSITESQYEKAKILKRAGISAEKADALTSERTLHKIDTDGSGRRSTAEIVAFLDRSGYTREQKRQMWYLYANKNWSNPYA